ncbi:MAG: hypothetical protein IJ773_14385 [Lachnospiraceae bacterium]|nr:hypothetical protein [Lachnospiraceae bacterium]
MIRMELLHAFFFDYCSRMDALPGASGCRGRLFILAFSPYAGFFSSFFSCFPKHHCISGKLCASSLPSFPVFRKIIVFQENQELLLFLFSLFTGKSLYFREVMCFFSSFFPCFPENHCISRKSRATPLPFFPVFWQIIVFQGNHVLLFFLFSLFSGKSLYFREVMCFFSSFFPCFLANHCISGKSCASFLPFFPVFWQIMVFQGSQEAPISASERGKALFLAFHLM